MAKKAKKIVAKIIKRVGNDRPKDWYAGITSDPDARLFGPPPGGHEVDKSDIDAWICFEAKSERGARKAERKLLEKGLDGGPGGGTGIGSVVHVYAYEKTDATTP